MPWIAHRRRGSEFGHHSFVFALVTPALLPLALRTSSLCHLLVLIHSLSWRTTRALNPSQTSTSSDGDTAVPASMLSAGPLLCL
jgi:hypothetical protein